MPYIDWCRQNVESELPVASKPEWHATWEGKGVKSNGNEEKGSKKEGNQESLLFKEEVSL